MHDAGSVHAIVCDIKVEHSGDLTGKVRFGQSRRKLMELEVKSPSNHITAIVISHSSKCLHYRHHYVHDKVAKFKGSSSHQMRSNPFSSGKFMRMWMTW